MGCPDGVCAGYELVADLDFDTNGNGRADAGDEYWDDGAGWLPIGTFSDTFDGGGHTISNLYINREGVNAGLFSSATGIISRVGLLSVNVSVKQLQTWRGPYGGIVGSLVGVNSGTISDSYATGDVTGGHYSYVRRTDRGGQWCHQRQLRCGHRDGHRR